MRTAPDLMYSAMDTISIAEIKEKLVRHHNPDELPENRELMVVRIDIDTGDGDVIFFVLPGLPPDGYGIFMQGRNLLMLYTTRGRPFEQISVDEVVNNV